jgi:hypothetical protein
VKRKYDMVISKMVKMSKEIKFVFIELILGKKSHGKIMMMEKTGGQGDQCHVRISTNS